MYDHQGSLKASFDQFIATIESEIDTLEYHILVTDTDEGPPDDCWTSCEKYGESGCWHYTDDSDDPVPLDCDDLGEYPTGCDATIGAGLTGLNDVDCGIDDDRRFLTQDTSDLSLSFSCVASVGIGGFHLERVADAMLAAVGPDLTAEGGCNDAFLREDALLLVTFITDEEDDNSAGDPKDWRAALIEAKGGVEEAIVVLGLIGDPEQKDAVCSSSGTHNSGAGAEAAPRLREFVESFDQQGLLGSVCEDTYDIFFAEAIELLDAHCQ
jgi:hypothetical protein